MVGNQLPVPLQLYPHPGKPIVTGNNFVFVLPNHCWSTSLHSRVSVYPHLNVVGGDRLKFQTTGCEIWNHLRLGSQCTAWSYTDKIIRIDAVKGHRVSTDLRLNAYAIQLSFVWAMLFSWLLPAFCFCPRAVEVAERAKRAIANVVLIKNSPLNNLFSKILLHEIMLIWLVQKRVL